MDANICRLFTDTIELNNSGDAATSAMFIVIAVTSSSHERKSERESRSDDGKNVKKSSTNDNSTSTPFSYESNHTKQHRARTATLLPTFSSFCITVTDPNRNQSTSLITYIDPVKLNILIEQ